MQLPADNSSPFPWMQVSTNVIARFTIQNENLKGSLLEFRILPGAEQSSSITLDEIINGEDWIVMDLKASFLANILIQIFPDSLS